MDVSAARGPRSRYAWCIRCGIRCSRCAGASLESSRAKCPMTPCRFFPAVDGKPVQKQAMIQTILCAASFLRVPVESPDGSEHITGHSLRPSGAQGLMRLGMDTWAIQLLGRWGSATVQRYIRDAAVSVEAAQARRHDLTRSLRDVRADAAATQTREDVLTLAASEVSRGLAGFSATFGAELREQWRRDLDDEIGRIQLACAPSSSSSSSSAAPVQ